MGIFGDFKQALSESPGRILWQQLCDTQQKLKALNDHVSAAALIRFADKRQKLIANLDNMTSKGRIEMGMTLQKHARSTFDMDMKEGYGLWLAGAWLESMERPGLEALKTHEYLEQLALKVEDEAY